MNEYRWRRRERSAELHGGSPGNQSMAAWLGFVKKRASTPIVSTVTLPTDKQTKPKTYPHK